MKGSTTTTGDSSIRGEVAGAVPRRALDRIGFEVELLAPPARSRRSLAERLALTLGGEARTVFHRDTEMALLKDRPVFHHLSLGFDVFDADGRFRCRLVDDVTIVSDLDARRRPEDGFYRILSDDRRLINLIARVADPEEVEEKVLEPVAELFGTETEPRPGGLVRLNDADGATIAMAASQGGERERVCEVITPPIDTDHHRRLTELLEPARRSGCTVPAEAAVHIHFDAEPFRSAPALASLVRTFSVDRECLLDDLGTNRRCRRIGALPAELVAEVERPGFTERPWSEVEAFLHDIDVTKHADVSLRALAGLTSAVDTVEIRILPGSIDPDRIMTLTDEVRRLLTRG